MRLRVPLRRLVAAVVVYGGCIYAAETTAGRLLKSDADQTDEPRPTEYRQVGWQINGGANDGVMVRDAELKGTLQEAPHGGYSPVYVEVGRD